VGVRTRDSEAEPDIAVNPADPSNFIVAYSQDLYDGYVVQTSFDHGRSWAERVPQNISTCSGGEFEIAADASVDIGPDGTAYLSSFVLDAPTPELALPHRTRLSVSTSVDGGNEWSDPVEVIGGALRMGDRPIITADPNQPGVAYVTASEAQSAFGGVFSIGFSRTDDGGRTWSPYRSIFAAEGAPNSNIIVSLKDGTLVLVTTINPYVNGQAPGTTPSRTVALRSQDGGVTWSLPVDVTEWSPTGEGSSDSPFHDPETGTPVEAQEDNTAVALAPDGTLYVAGRNSTGDGSSEIAVVRSDDGGRTWGEQLVVARGGHQKWMPSIAVDGDGTVGLTYYDHRNDVLGDDPFTTDMWFAHSRDAGRTWTERHLAGSFDLRTATHRKIPVDGLFLGDYQGIAGLAKGFVAAFAMSRPVATVGHSDIFFSHMKTPRSQGHLMLPRSKVPSKGIGFAS
jgi:Neuraminidase (sialidase)